MNVDSREGGIKKNDVKGAHTSIQSVVCERRSAGVMRFFMTFLGQQQHGRRARERGGEHRGHRRLGTGAGGAARLVPPAGEVEVVRR